MRILFALYYYRPYISGLTIYVERLAVALARRGHTVTVLTSQYDAALPREQWADGVRIVRVPVALRISKGVIMPAIGRVAGELAREHDVLSIHLPNVDAPGLTLRGRLRHRPVILTYHCDLKLPPGLFNRLIDRGVFIAHYAAARLADKIVAYTRDYAAHSRLLSPLGQKLVVIPPPVVMPAPRADEVAAFKALHCADGGPVIGMVARLAAEKGVEYLVEAMPRVLARFPRAKVLFAGPYEDVLGEQAYRRRLRGPIERLGARWVFLGPLDQDRLPAFYGACDVVAVPSLNSTEGFSLVQVEAMLCGTPAVVSDLPGVRQPIRLTGMGEIVAPGSASALAEGLERVLSHRERYVRPRPEIEARFDPQHTADAYVALFDQELARRSR
jgi:glycosyltransferase involved in cell wall biosynthesis